MGQWVLISEEPYKHVAMPSGRSNRSPCNLILSVCSFRLDCSRVVPHLKVVTVEMPVVPFSLFDPNSFTNYMDLSSLPPLRHLRLNFLTEFLRTSIAFDYVSIGGLRLTGFEFGNARSIDSDMPPLMLEQYFDRGVGKSDPLVLAAFAARGVVTDVEAYDRFELSDELRALFRQFGVRNRTLIPIRSEEGIYGCVIFARQQAFTNDEKQFLSFISPPLHTAVKKPIMDRYAAQYLEITPGELLCLRLASRGCTSDEIAAESGYEIRTVDNYIRSVTKKLDASNRVEAVAEAIRRALIS